MRKLFFICLLILCFAGSAYALPTLRYERDATIGGTKSCDNIPYATLTDTATYDGATCVVTTTAGVRSVYVWDATATAAEDDPWVLEADDDAGGDGRWEVTTSTVRGRLPVPAITFRDSGCTDDDINAYIYTNCTNEGSTTEECPVYIQGQTGGILTTYARFMGPETETFTTEANLDITAPLVLLDGDNDTDNDTLDLQDGDFPGQTLQLVAAVDIDTNDTVTIAMTDTTCTNCPAIVFDKIGENAQLTWTGTTWVVGSVQSSL